MLKHKITKRALYELVAVPVALAALGLLLLRASDGAWWGVACWVVAAPLVYLLIDVFVFARRDAASARRAGRVTTAASTAARGKGSPPRAGKPHVERWSGVGKRSAGAEILRRGRRYDRRTG